MVPSTPGWLPQGGMTSAQSGSAQSVSPSESLSSPSPRISPQAGWMPLHSGSSQSARPSPLSSTPFSQSSEHWGLSAQSVSTQSTSPSRSLSSPSEQNSGLDWQMSVSRQSASTQSTAPSPSSSIRLAQFSSPGLALLSEQAAPQAPTAAIPRTISNRHSAVFIDMRGPFFLGSCPWILARYACFGQFRPGKMGTTARGAARQGRGWPLRWAVSFRRRTPRSFSMTVAGMRTRESRSSIQRTGTSTIR